MTRILVGLGIACLVNACSCDAATCVRAVECVEMCGGAIVSSGCGPCASGTIDRITCPMTDGGTDGGTTRSCEVTPCFRANRCFDTCGGTLVYEGCCECPAGSVEELTCRDAGAVDGGPGPTDGGLPVGARCAADAECEAGLCYGAADSTGAFTPPTCQASCIGFDDRSVYCLDDGHCCGGTCCLGCGELEGLCRMR